MKIKQLLIFSLVAISSAFWLNSCGPENINPAPGIDIIAEGGSITGDVSMDGDKSFTLVFQVSDNSKVKSVEVYSVVDGRKSIQLDTTINASSSKIKLTRRSLARKTKEVWTISATDDEGKSSSTSLTITTTSEIGGDNLASYTKDNFEQPLKVWNVYGPNAGAFDLLDGTPRVKDDPAAEKDLHDSCAQTEIPQWPGRLTSKNGTTFKKVTLYAYSDISNTGQLDAAWNASGSAKKFLTVQAGDLFIANILQRVVPPLRSGGKVLVYVVEVKKTPGTNNDNLDYIHFNFKKKP